MNVKDLLFFNKEGYAINADYNEELDLWSSKMLFDKNSTDTYKTQGLYLFETVQGTQNTFELELNKFQIFNTNNFHFYPKPQINELEITKIETVNNSPDYNTKWVYANNIGIFFYPGSYCYFENLNGFHNEDFDTVESINLYHNVKKVLEVRKDKILVFTSTPNDIPITNTLPLNSKIIPINIIEVQQLNEPTWNQTNLNNNLYIGKKISVISGTNNDNIYTIKNLAQEKVKNEYILPVNLHTPNAGDILNIELELKTSNIIISSGNTIFGASATNEIQVPYIPQFLNIGDQIRAFVNVGTLSLTNAVQLEVIDINYNTNIITVNQPLVNETIDVEIRLVSNTFKIQQPIVLDNNNQYSLPLTYWSIVNTFGNELLNVSGGYNLNYIKDFDQLQIVSEFNNLYTDINVFITDINGNVINLNAGIINNIYDIIPLYVEENINEQLTINKDANLYNRNIIFNNIDNFGLNININGIDYNIPTDVTVLDTLNDWITAYQSDLNDIGIEVQIIGTDTLNITSDFPNVPIFTQLNMGNLSNYYVEYKDIEFNFIKNQLLININDEEYLVPFVNNDITTVTNWVNTYQNILANLGILIDNTNNIIHFRLLDPERELNISYNIGFIPKSGDLSVYETLFATNSESSIISGNELLNTNSNINFLNFYAIGQKIAITGAHKLPQNKSYNIIGITNNTLQLSYQGAFWQQGLSDISINSDFFIRKPKSGIQSIGNNATLKWSFKDIKTPDFFLYDFTGDQLQPHQPGFPDYNGTKPLCGIDGNIELKLNKKPNKNINDISNPVKQQTVFDIIKHDLNFLNFVENPNIEPSPLQVFIGYNSNIEGWNKTRLYLDLIENVEFDLNTSLNQTDNLWVFKDNYVEIQNITIINFSFLQLGFKKNQIIEFAFNDITDNKDLATLKNGGIKYRIKEVTPKRIYFTKDVIEETSVIQVPTSTLPYYDLNGDPIFETRILSVKIKVIPRVIAYFDLFGESENEDERHKININNRNFNLLKLSDFYIFKDVDINEEGIDWVFLNQKRKELLEIYPELTNYISSYKSIIKAINFFGYNDLTFTEYFQNINPDSEKFGKLFNLELLNIFDKSTKGWKFSNLSYKNLRNLGYRKTNLFSLNYSITDNNGNFINSYSPDEVKIKLLGLKKWLTNNLIPIGTKILDINGKFIDQDNFKYLHETYMNQRFNVEEYSSPIDFDIEGHLYPVTNGSDIYNISVQFKSQLPIEWFQYTIKTFYIHIWDENTTYLINDVVKFNNKYYKALNNISTGQQPDLVSDWKETNLDNIQYIQILQDYKTANNTNTSFTINKNIDPHFIIETSWHSGYANSFKISKTYSLIDGFF